MRALKHPDRRRGAVLFISIAILGLLALFALSFVKLVNFEKVASTNYTDSVRARLLARAGIRRAVAELQDLGGRRYYSDPVNDGWGYGLKSPSTLNATQRKDLNLKLNLMLTTEPSFKMKNLGPITGSRCDGGNHSSTNCKKNDPVMYRSALAVSGVLGRSYENGADVYKLKVLDSASQVNLNHPDPAAAQRMLKNLLRSVAEDFDPPWSLGGDPNQVARAIAAHVILNRPTSGFRSKAEIQALLMVDPATHSPTCPCNNASLGGYSLSGVNDTNRVTELRWEAGLRDLLTVYSWIDGKVIRPWQLNPELPSGHAYYTLPKRELPLMARAPINVNTASKSVLVALFCDLETRNDYGTFRVGYDDARILADQIIEWRRGGRSVNVSSQFAERWGDVQTGTGSRITSGPFKSWVQFELWLDHERAPSPGGGLVRLWGSSPLRTLSRPTPEVDPGTRTLGYLVAPRGTKAQQDASYQGVKTPNGFPNEGLVPLTIYAGVSPTWRVLGLAQGVRDAIKSQLNPNTMLTKFGQGANHGGRWQAGMPIARLADKSDLVHMTTEGCFDSMGVFEITSLGMVLKRDVGLAESLTDFLGGTTNENEMDVVAAQTQQVVIRVYDVLRFTSQVDFERFRGMQMSGDFIPDYQLWRSLLGVNRGSTEIMNSKGWPGLITQPVYSISRDDRITHEIADDYTPAQYDGHLTLTNLLGVTAQPYDFVAGFARGTIEAFKCRVWWDPKDQYPYNDGAPNTAGAGWPYPSSASGPGEPKLPHTASHPSHPDAPLESDGTRLWSVWPPDSVTSDKVEDWYDGAASPDGIRFKKDALIDLCKPMAGAEPRNKGRRSQDRSPLDAKTAMPPTKGDWWHEGSSLWNNGVAIGPRRGITKPDGTIQPYALAFNGNNLNLERTCSIRVWVQPLADPYLREEEVLMSFIGSNGSEVGNGGGNKRQVGFRVVKRADLDGSVVIELQACPINDAENITGPTGNMGSNPGGVSVRELGWNFQTGRIDKWSNVVKIDVKPRLDDRFAGKHEDLASLDPEWVQNSWHWVVVNYGYARADNGVDPVSGGNLNFAQFDMALQVDMKPTQPPRAFDPAEGAQRIAFAGDSVFGTGFDSYGELHGYEPGTGRNSTEPLGTRTGTLNSDPVELPSGNSGRGIAVWLEPRVLGDFYNCRAGSVVEEPGERFFAGAVTWDGNQHTTSQGINFPPESINRKVFLRWPDGTERAMTYDETGGIAGNWTFVFEVGSQGTNGSWSGSYGPDGTPGTSDDAPLDIRMSWIVLKSDGSTKNPHCTAKEIRPGIWDGAAMQKLVNDRNAGKSPPDIGDGDNQCVARAWINGRPPATGPTGKACWTVSNKGMKGQERVISAPGWSGTVPRNFICDGCRGCENCDVDAPLFIGGEPIQRSGGALNFASTGETALIDPATVAYAVFDNLVIKNKRESEARTDYAASGSFVDAAGDSGYQVPGAGDGSVGSAPVDWYQDRFFESSTSSQHFDAAKAKGASVNVTSGYGATYRRALLELVGSRARIGSMTWTSYPSSDGRMQYEVSLKRFPGKDNGNSMWPGNQDLTSGAPTTPAIETKVEFIQDEYDNDARSRIVTASSVSGYKQGLAFGSKRVYDGASTNYDILLLKIELGNLYKAGMDDLAAKDYGPDGIYGTADDLPDPAREAVMVAQQQWGMHTGVSGAPVDILPSTASGLPTPITESPVFEDVTINLLRETPQFLYAEEGVAE